MIPDSVEKIGANAFKNCKMLKTVTMSSKLKTIGKGCFQGCSMLKKVKLSANLTVIDEAVFSGCESLEKIVLYKKVICIKSNAFYNCKSLKTITVPSGIETIEEDAFDGCISLKEIPNISSNKKGNELNEENSAFDVNLLFKGELKKFGYDTIDEIPESFFEDVLDGDKLKDISNKKCQCFINGNPITINIQFHRALSTLWNRFGNYINGKENENFIGGSIYDPIDSDIKFHAENVKVNIYGDLQIPEDTAADHK